MWYNNLIILNNNESKIFEVFKQLRANAISNIWLLFSTIKTFSYQEGTEIEITLLTNQIYFWRQLLELLKK